MKAVFIIGYWNSGTSLLTDILRKHPDLSLKVGRFKATREEKTTQKILRQLGTDYLQMDYEAVKKKGVIDYAEPQLDAAQSREFRRLFLKNFGVKAGQSILLKNPYMFYCPTFLQKEFGDIDLKKIIILRDGRSQVVSKDYWKKKGNNPRETLLLRTHFWAASMDYFFKNWYNKGDVLTLRYENLCNHTHKTFQQICEYAQLPLAPLLPKIPTDLENRMTKWEQLDENLKQEVNAILGLQQAKMDELLPV